MTSLGSHNPGLVSCRAPQLAVSVGQYSSHGRKAINQDFHGVYLPAEPLRASKGVALAIADGIGSSAVSQVASEVAVSGFLADYFSTPEAWSVRKAGQRVLMATNSWLHAHNRRSGFHCEMDKGYVCTFSALVLKSATAHLFHIGDSRVHRLRQNNHELLTTDHRLQVSREVSYLSRALGMNPQLEIDYHSLPLEPGDVFLLTTDGVHGHMAPELIARIVDEHAQNLDLAARILVEHAFASGSDDNLTVQIVRVDAIADADPGEFQRQREQLPPAPVLESRMEFDGYRILRELHASSRSHVYLATDIESGQTVVLKTPSIDLKEDKAYLDRFLMEEWIARRIDSPHVLKPCARNRQRKFLYTATEFIDGQTLTQWLRDNPQPGLETVRGIVEQIAKGLRAFHRLEMLHLDLRPDNVMIDRTGTVKIIDFGSTRVAGLMESTPSREHEPVLGTAAFSAPECFLGEIPTTRSDIFSLGVMTYHMLSGRLPYGAEVAKARTRAAQNRLSYGPVLASNPDLPPWVDAVLRKAVHPDPSRRYQALSEFMFDLRHPKGTLPDQARLSLMERDPVRFWQVIAFALLCMLLAQALADFL